MSISAIPSQPALEQQTWAARLIPGSALGRTATRKPPQAVRADERWNAAYVTAGTRRPARTITWFLLPSPFGAEDLGRFWTSLLRDYTVILCSWICIAGLLRAVRQGWDFTIDGLPESELSLESLGSGFLFALIVTLLGYSEGLYQSSPRLSSQWPILMKVVLWSTALLGMLTRLTGLHVLLEELGSSAVLSLGMLLLSRKWRHHLRARSSGQHVRNVLIVGTGAAGRELADYINCHPEEERTVCGFLDDDNRQSFGVLGRPENLAAIARAEFVDEVIVATPHRPDVIQFVIREARRNHLDVKVVPEFYGCEVQRPGIESVGKVSLIKLHQERLPSLELLIKRSLDVLLSACLLLLGLPLLVTIAAMIRFDSKGPILYNALRIGKKGRRFRCYKFRTMVADAAQHKERLRMRNQREGPCFKLADDPRITRVGHFLRRYSLDELPQLWNVFKGDMSLVGPRPHPVDDFARYELQHFRRLDVMPGITGLWQVSARGVASFQTNLALDLEYIERWTLWLDLKILWKTCLVVLQGTGV